MNIQRGITAEARSDPARLIIVEDDAIVAEDIRQTLEGLDYEVVHSCPRGEWVMEAAREYEPDLVLMDIRLAGEMDGIEAGDTLQRQLDVPVVYLTAYADEDTLERARRSAPYGYVVKPFSEQGLQTAVEVALVRHRMQQRLRESEQRFRQMARAIEEVFYLWDYTTEPPQLLYVSPAYEEIWGRPVAPLYEDPARWTETILDEDIGPTGSERAHRREKPVVTEYRIQRPDGEIRWIQDRAFPVREGPDDEVSRVCGVARDVTARKRFEDELERRALHDHLTGLPNRALFRDRLNHALDRSERTAELLAVFFLDLKRFKVVNDSLGHAAGDRLLEEVARRLSRTVRDQDTVARVGGDEFTVLLEEIGGEEEAITVARRIVEVLGEPVALDARDVTVDASIGIAFHRGGEDATSGPSDLVRWADDAMYRAKERPGTHFVIADRAGDAPMTVRLEREARLRSALQEGSIPTVYQPVYELDSGALYGVEALARWRDAELGTVSPEVFVPLAEETGLIVQLWEQQMERACRLMLERPFGEGHSGEPLQLHVNLSAHQLDDPDLVDRTRRILEATGFPAERLSLEVTESAAMGKPRALDQLHELGVALAIDDFGTRYSTLAQLRRLNIDALKIDRTFIAGLLEAEKDRAIVDTVLTLGKSLDLSVIAEGIESEDQLALLRELGCDRAQGFLLARPMEADELRKTVGR